MTSTGTPRHFLSIDDFDYSELRGMLEAAGSLKARLKPYLQTGDWSEGGPKKR